MKKVLLRLLFLLIVTLVMGCGTSSKKYDYPAQKGGGYLSIAVVSDDDLLSTKFAEIALATVVKSSLQIMKIITVSSVVDEVLNRCAKRTVVDPVSNIEFYVQYKPACTNKDVQKISFIFATLIER